MDYKPLIIAVDFDGTIVENRYPEIGEELPFATDTLKMLIAEHHRLILWTSRQGVLLQEAVSWCKDRGIEFYAVNKSFPEETYGEGSNYMRKIVADVFIDDRSIGGMLDWELIWRMISQRITWKEVLEDMQIEENACNKDYKKKRKWWQKAFCL